MLCYLLAAEVGLEEATQSARPTRKSCAAGKEQPLGTRSSPGWGEAGKRSPHDPCIYPTPPSCLPWLICSQANCKAFWVSGCPHSHPPLQNTRCPRLSSPHACAVLRAPRNTWPSPSRVSARPMPHPHPRLWHCVASTPGPWFPVSNRRTRDPAAADCSQAQVALLSGLAVRLNWVKAKLNTRNILRKLIDATEAFSERF